MVLMPFRALIVFRELFWYFKIPLLGVEGDMPPTPGGLRAEIWSSEHLHVG